MSKDNFVVLDCGEDGKFFIATVPIIARLAKYSSHFWTEEETHKHLTQLKSSYGQGLLWQDTKIKLHTFFKIQLQEFFNISDLETSEIQSVLLKQSPSAYNAYVFDLNKIKNVKSRQESMISKLLDVLNKLNTEAKKSVSTYPVILIKQTDNSKKEMQPITNNSPKHRYMLKKDVNLERIKRSKQNIDISLSTIVQERPCSVNKSWTEKNHISNNNELNYHSENNDYDEPLFNRPLPPLNNPVNNHLKKYYVWNPNSTMFLNHISLKSYQTIPDNNKQSQEQPKTYNNGPGN